MCIDDNHNNNGPMISFFLITMNIMVNYKNTKQYRQINNMIEYINYTIT